MHKPLIPAILGSSLLLSVAGAQAADVVAANCTAANTAAAIVMDESGAASIKTSIGGQEFSCGMQLGQLSGPPFSESMTGMLVLSFEREACQPKAGNRRVMREISLHIEDPTGAASTGMTMVQRRPVMYECKLAGFDLSAVRKLIAADKGIKIYSDAP